MVGKKYVDRLEIEEGIKEIEIGLPNAKTTFKSPIKTTREKNT